VFPQLKSVNANNVNLDSCLQSKNNSNYNSLVQFIAGITNNSLGGTSDSI